jgi:hypothetical protein
MSIILDRSEFFALAAMLRATDVFGLEAAALLPSEPAALQALYDRGRERLAARDLIRRTPAGEIAIEQGLRDVMAMVLDPDQAVLAARYLPGRGRQVFLYYGRGGSFVEQTLPDNHTHQISLLGDAEALVSRLMEIFPVSALPFVPESFTATATALRSAFQQVEAGDVETARNLLAAAPTSDATLGDYMAVLFGSAVFNGNLTFVRSTPGGVAQSLDLSLVQAPDEAWGITPTDDPAVLRAERMNAAVLRATLHRTIDGARQPARATI